MALSRSFRIWIACAMLFIVGLLWLAYFYFTLAPVAMEFDLPGTATSTPAVGITPVVIEQGSGLKEITTMLFDQHLVRSASAMRLYAILSGNAHQLKPGFYTFSPSSSTQEITQALVAGPVKEITILFPEGQTAREVDAELAKYGVIHKGALLKLNVADFYDQYPFLRGARNFEGFLFPDTYRFYFNSDPAEVAKAFLDKYAARVGPQVSDGGVVDYDNIPIARRGIFNSLQITTIASLIEKEVPGSADRKLVADIIYRRLKMDMPLQIDASVEYAKEHGTKYDTYAQYGLPIGPIANPGLDAIDAALNPRSSSYLYYLSDPKTKKTIFSKTFEEHKANIAKYL
jgi:UPF0755 protein